MSENVNIDNLTGERKTLNDSETYTKDDGNVLRYSYICDICQVFLEGFKKGGKDDDEYYYFEIINNMMGDKETTLEIDFMDIFDAKEFKHDYNKKIIENAEILFDILVNNTRLFIRAMRKAAFSILSNIHHDYAMEVVNDFQVRITNAILLKKEITEINSADVGKLVYSENFVISISSQKNYTKSMAWACLSCGRLTYKDSIGFKLPKLKKCPYCESDDIRESDKDAITDTMQEIKLQQKYERIVSGRIPKTIMGIIYGKNMINKINAGDIAAITGIINIQRNTSPAENAVADYYIEIQSLEKKSDDFLIEQDPELEERVKQFIDPENEDTGYQNLVESIAPSILGHEIIKEALLLQLVGSDVAYFSDNSRHRGEINLMLVGDAATAKSKMATYVYQLYPRAVYTNSKVTKAGMTASVRIEKTGHAVLEAGAYLLASSEMGGIVVCDEMEKAPLEAREATSPLMDDRQILTINTGPLHQNIQINCASLHIANPKTGESWNEELTIKENTGFENWYLSRFCTWIVRDEVNEELDTMKAEHFINQFGNTIRQHKIRDSSSDIMFDEVRKSKKKSSYLDNRNIKSVAEMRMYYKYARTFHPEISPKSKATDRLIKYYLSVRPSSGLPGGPKITMRQLGDLVRFSEASARAHFRNYVTEKDAEIAINIVSSSIASSGFNIFTGKYEHTATSDSEKNLNRHAMSYDTGGGFVMASELLLKNSTARQIVSNDLEVLVRKRKDRFYREMSSKAKQFVRVIKHQALLRCKDCNGHGSRMDGRVQQQCYTCSGTGGFTNPFNYNDVVIQLGNAGFNNQDIQDFMTIMLRKKIFKQDSRNTNTYYLTDDFGKANVTLTAIQANIDLLYESDLDTLNNSSNPITNNPDLKQRIENFKKMIPDDYMDSIREKLKKY